MNDTAQNDRNKPDFLIIGAAKCGTTTLYDDLSRLDGLYLPSDKEPSILTKRLEIEAMRRDYLIHFKGARPDQLCGEGSTNYTKRPEFEGVAEKAYQLCGEKLKLIMIMRDPIERIYSHLRHNIAARKILPNEIDQVVLGDPAYIAMSDYAMQLKPWVETFGVGNIFCLSLSVYHQARGQIIGNIAAFLDISANRSPLDNGGISNKSSELRYTSKNIASLLQTSLYRLYVRPLLSDDARALYRRFLLPKASAPVIKLSKPVEHKLRERLGNVENDVEALIGKRIPIYAK